VLQAQLTDTLAAKKDSLLQPQLTPYQLVVKNIVADNKYLNTQAEPVFAIISYKKPFSKTFPFYLLLSIIAFLGIVKFIYPRYFTTLFKVFFNTSLKQSQLTDQLLQTKLPSLLFNIIFVIVSAVYMFTLLNHYHYKTNYNTLFLLLLCTILIATIYLCKYSTLKLTGWLTGNLSVTNSYTFIIFLINKILAVLLLPLIAIIVFAKPIIANQAIILSFLVIGFMFILRFFRSYGALQHKLKISKFHFFIYIIGVEVLPLLVCYKALALFLSKNT
jgi:hypothetical protein